MCSGSKNSTRSNGWPRGAHWIAAAGAGVEQHLAQLQPGLHVFGLQADDLPVDPLRLGGVAAEERIPGLEQPPVPFRQPAAVSHRPAAAESIALESSAHQEATESQ